MTRYTNVKVRISESQKDKIKKAFESNCKSITIRLTCSDLHGDDDIALTNSELDRILEAYEEKKDMTIKMSKTQLAYNMKIDGWFLPALAGLIPFLTGTVLPAWKVGATSGLARKGVQKLIGNGLCLKKGSGVCRIGTDEEGLYLGATSRRGFEIVGNGLYMMKQGGLYDGKRLILGPNSPFKNIPILAMILWYYFQK